jgi:hypothetical protein
MSIDALWEQPLAAENILVPSHIVSQVAFKGLFPPLFLHLSPNSEVIANREQGVVTHAYNPSYLGGL